MKSNTKEKMQKILLILVFLTTLQCNSSNKNKKKCFLNQVGEYKLDIKKTKENLFDSNAYLLNTDRLKKFRIVFNKDSTFYMNMKVDFFEDTFGFWKSGDCKFESPGTLSYHHSPAIEQFGQCSIGDTFCTRVALFSEKYGSITFWFRKTDIH